MAAQLGGIIARCALGPLTYAGSLVMAGRVPDGLRELSPDSLAGGLERGVREAAERAGVKPRDVQRLMPWSDVQGLVARLGETQPAAVDAWQAHAGQIGGLMQGVADLTVDGRVPDVALCLERLAKKVSRDAPLADPLRALAADIARWQEVVAECRAAIDDGGVLARAYRMRRIRYAVMIVSALAVVTSLAVLGLRVRATRARVEAGLAPSDPCAVEAIAREDLDRASDDQHERAAAKRAACTADRERREAERVAEEERKARELEAQRVRDAHEAACAKLAADVEKGSLDGADRMTAGPSAALLGRVARRELAAGDFELVAPTYPCADSKVAASFARAFERTLVRGGWEYADQFSKPVLAMLVKHAGELGKGSKLTFGARADALAKRGVEGGDHDVIEKAGAMCTVANRLGAEIKGFCPAARTFAARP